MPLVNLPLLGAVRLQHKHVVFILVGVESLRAGWGDIGVGLNGMPQRLFELPAEESEGLPVAVHALEDHGCPGGELAEHGLGVQHACGRLGAGASCLRVAARREACAVPHQSECGQAQALGGDDAIDVVQGEQVVEASTPFGRSVKGSLTPELLFEPPRIPDAPVKGAGIRGFDWAGPGMQGQLS